MAIILRQETIDYLKAAAGRLLSELQTKRDEVLACDFWERIQEHQRGEQVPSFYVNEWIPEELIDVKAVILIAIRPVLVSIRKWELFVSVYNMAEGWKISRVLRVGAREEILDYWKTKELKEELEKALIHLTDELKHE